MASCTSAGAAAMLKSPTSITCTAHTVTYSVQAVLEDITAEYHCAGVTYGRPPPPPGHHARPVCHAQSRSSCSCSCVSATHCWTHNLRQYLSAHPSELRSVHTRHMQAVLRMLHAVPYLPPCTAKLLHPLPECSQEGQLSWQAGACGAVTSIRHIHVEQDKRAMVCHNGPGGESQSGRAGSSS
jgi:hypothetical protein